MFYIYLIKIIYLLIKLFIKYLVYYIIGIT